jgi:hypothetical protein
MSEQGPRQARAFDPLGEELTAKFWALKNVNNQTIIAALDKLTVTLPVFPAPINFSSPLPVKGATRVFNATYVPSVAKDGHLVASGGTVNTLPALQQSMGSS